MMKIVLVNDQIIIRKGLKSILALQNSMEVLGGASNKLEALHMIKREKPDLVVLDLHLGKECGLEIITDARKLGYIGKFAILTYSKDPLSFERAKDLEIDGYISLEVDTEEIIFALQAIQKGRKYYDPDIIDLLMKLPRKPQVDSAPVEHLTSKEKEVLLKLGMGFSNRQIAQNLFITENTVKKHVGQVLSKLNLGDRTQAALYANETGLVQYKYNVLV